MDNMTRQYLNYFFLEAVYSFRYYVKHFTNKQDPSFKHGSNRIKN